MKEILKKLVAPYGATGREETVADVIVRLVTPYVDSIERDALGNVICRRSGSGARVMLAAHMDHIGFMVTDIDQEGFLRVHNVGGIDKDASLHRHVVFENGLQGLVSCEKKEYDPADRSMRKLFIDIGANSKEEAEKLVSRGDVAVYAPDCFELAGDRVSAPAMDNRAGCAVLVKTLMELKDCPNEVVAVFTVQEEVGMRGAMAAAYGIAPQVGIALDVTPCGDVPNGVPLPVKLGEGVAVKIMDASLIAHSGVVKRLEAAGDASGAKYQREVLPYGGTDAAAIMLTRGGVPSGVLSIPCRYVHSAVETVSIGDMDAAVTLLIQYLSQAELY